MKTLSVARLALFVALFTVIAAVAYAAKVKPTWPINEVAVNGQISDQQRDAVYEFLARDGMSDMPMLELQQKFESRSWISSATLARRWPDGLLVTIVPEQPIALWNDDDYLNEKGRVFSSPFVNQERLPQLYGPEGKQELVMAQYLQLNNMLFKGGQQIDQLTLDERGNWQFKSNQQFDVLLGKTALMERVQRLLQVTEHIAANGKLNQIKQIDTRYVNGAAVAWHDHSLVAQTVSTELKLATNYNSQRESKL